MPSAVHVESGPIGKMAAVAAYCNAALARQEPMVNVAQSLLQSAIQSGASPKAVAALGASLLRMVVETSLPSGGSYLESTDPLEADVCDRLQNCIKLHMLATLGGARPSGR